MTEARRNLLDDVHGSAVRVVKLRSPVTDHWLAATVPGLRRRRQGDAAVRANLVYKLEGGTQRPDCQVPGATAGFRPGDRVPGVPTRCNMSHESQFGVPPETEWDD